MKTLSEEIECNKKLSDPAARIEFWHDGKPLEVKFSKRIPLVGDQIEIYSITYKVIGRKWIYNFEYDHIKITLNRKDD